MSSNRLVVLPENDVHTGGVWKKSWYETCSWCPCEHLVFPESVCEGFFVKNICRTTYHLHLHIFTSAHPHSHLYLCSCSHLRIYISAHLHICTPTSPLIFTSLLIFYITSTSHIFTSRSSLLSLLRPGAVPPEHHETQPSAEIVRVEGAKCRRECDLVLSGATLCGDRRCRGREMQARVRFGFGGGNPLRRSCVLRARSAGESAI